MGFGVLPLRGAAKVVAASDSIDKTRADYVCDGTDDQSEINSAIEALGTTGGKVLLLEGTYSISASVNLASKVALVGQGRGTVLKIPDRLDAHINVISGSSIDRVLVANLMVDGNEGNQTAGNMYGIHFDTVTHSKIVNCWVESLRLRGIFLYSSTNNIVVGNNIKDNKNYGIYLEVSSDNNAIIGNNCQSNTTRGIYLHSSINNIIVGNNVQENGSGIYLYNNSNNNAITGNSVRLNKHHGIHVLQSSYNSIVGNTLHNNSQAAHNTYNEIFLDDDGATYSTYNVVVGNTILCDVVGPPPLKAAYGIMENDPGDNYNIVKGNVVEGPATANILTKGLNTHTTLDRELFIPIFDDQDANVSLSSFSHYVTLEFADGVVGRARANFTVPDDFVSFGSVKAVWVGGIGAVDMYWRLQAIYGAHGEVPASDTPAYGTTTSTGTLQINIQEPANPLTLSGLARGDVVGIEFYRDASNAADTIDDAVALLGLLFTYTAEQ